MKSSYNTLEERWNIFRQLTRDLAGELHVRMIDHLRDDVKDEGVIYLGLFRAPAAKGNHHDREGGLIAHMLEMWEIWLHLKDAIVRTDGKYITDARVFKGILYHDLHKAYRTFVEVPRADGVWAADYGKDPTESLMSHTTKTIWILSQAGISLDRQDYHALLCNEGGWAEIKTRWTSVLAKLLYVLDELSGNVVERIRKGTYLDHRTPV